MYSKLAIALAQDVLEMVTTIPFIIAFYKTSKNTKTANLIAIPNASQEGKQRVAKKNPVTSRRQKKQWTQ